MLWDGNRQAQEYTDTHIFTTIYEQNSFEPVARLVWLKDELLKAANDEIKNAERESWEDAPTLIPSMQVYHYHNDHLGTPNELTNQEGEVVWLADYEAWGETRVEMCWEHILASQGESYARVAGEVVWREEKLEQLQVSSDELQPIRFQGQSFDTETGLHYNRFRYYDPDLGMFTTRDPIGLDGGNNVFAYAPNPTGWIDPFGLTKKPGGCDCNIDIPPYDERIRRRAVEDPNYHNFPFSFDKEVLSTKPVQLERGGLGYTLIGENNGREVVYNIIVKDGVITHRDAIPISKWGQRSRSFGWPITIEDIAR